MIIFTTETRWTEFIDHCKANNACQKAIDWMESIDKPDFTCIPIVLWIIRIFLNYRY